MRGSEFIVITYKDVKLKHRIKFIDTFSFLKTSVQQLGKIIGLEKLKKPEFLGNIPKNDEEKKILEDYNVNDSYISYKFMCFLQNEFNNIGITMSNTIASTAMRLFQNNYLKYWIRQPVKEVIDEMYKGYYGGRVECFYRGYIENVNYYDINSLYPFVMKKYAFPMPNSIQLNEAPTGLSLLDYAGLSEAQVRCPDNLDIPLLPTRDSNKLMFPTGDFIGYFTHAELKKAKSLGYRIKLLKTYYYTETFNPFAEYVEDLYNRRNEYKKLNSPLAIVYKLCLNSLYGKFGQKIEQTEILFGDNPEDIQKIIEAEKDTYRVDIDGKATGRYKIDFPKTCEVMHPDGTLWNESNIYYVTDLQRKKYPHFINPILSIYITSYARLELYERMEKCNTVYYCDTDSIMTPDILPTSDNLGDLKLEIKADKGIIVRPKFYYLQEGNKVILKSKGLTGLKELVDFTNVLKTGQYTYKKFTKFKESIKRNMPFNQIIDVTKFVEFEDDKRNWLYPFSMKKEKSQPVKVGIL
jgi:hypothetical protein